MCGLAGQPVHLVEDDEGDLGVSRHGPQIALMEDGVRVLLRVDDPDDRVDERQDPVDLFAVLHGRRIVVGQVHQDEPAQLCLSFRALEGAPAQPSGDAEPVDERGRAVAPAARDGRRGGRPAYAGFRNGHSGEHVEELGLAAAGRARDGDDGVLPGQPAPRHRLVQYPACLCERPAVQPGPRQPHQLAQGVQPRPQRPVVREGLGRLDGLAPGLQEGGHLLLPVGRLGHAPGDQPVAPGLAGLRGIRGFRGLRTARRVGVGGRRGGKPRFTRV